MMDISGFTAINGGAILLYNLRRSHAGAWEREGLDAFSHSLFRTVNQENQYIV